jgi:signal transduction histidine kinase
MDWIVQEVLVRLSYLIESSEAQISQLENWPPCRGYAPWIEEIWANYISNAIKYGGHPPLIELGATPLDHQRVKFWVQDNGEGIPLEDADRLFNPHVRLDNIRATGSGLGLSIVRRIASRLEGEVGYEAVENGGSRFYFILPVV